MPRSTARGSATSATFAIGSPGVTDERSRLDRARAEKVEADLRAQLQDLIEPATATRVIVALATRARECLSAVPGAVATALAGEKSVQRCTQILDDAIRAALEGLATEGDRAARRIAAEGPR